MKHSIFTLITIILFSACNIKEDPEIDYREQNDTEIQAYIATNNINAQKLNSGLYYIIDNVGTGKNPTLTDRIKVKYKGYLTDGTVFQELDDVGVSFFLNEIIAGWQIGLPFFKEGGSGKLIIPAHLGYGGRQVGIIPPGSVLIFEIELIYVNYEKENDEQIQAYLIEQGLTAQPTGSGLYYNISPPSNGTTKPTTSSTVSVTYKGTLINGNVFDERTTPQIFSLQNVITGFSEGLSYFSAGDTGTLYIPAHLGYGNQQLQSIPIGSVLIFQVNLISIN